MAGFLPPTVAYLLGNITDYKAKMDEAGAISEKTDAKMTGMGTGAKMGLLALGAAIAGVGYESVKLATTFDATMTRINTQDNANLTVQQMKNLKASVEDLAGPVAQTPDALAEAMIHVYGSGLQGAKALDTLKIAAEGASVGNADLVDVTNALDAAIAVNIPGVQNTAQAMGELNATVGAGDMTMQNLAEALGGPMLATVKGYGLNITDVGAALAVFGDRNIRGAEAATELRMATQALAVPASSGKKAIESIGLSVTSLRDDLLHGGLKQALDDLNDHLLKAGYNSKTAGALITEIFGKKAGGGLNVLMDSLSSSTSNFNEKFAAVAKSGQTFGKDWAQTQDTLAFKIRSLGDTLDGLGIKLGSVLIPVLSRFLGWILTGISWLGQHKAVLAVLAGVLAGALVSALYAAAAATVAWTVALDVNPIFLAITAIAGLVGGLIYAYNHFKTFRDVVDAVGRFFRGVWQDAMHIAGDVIKWFTDGPLVWIKARLAELTAFWKAHGAQIIEIAKVAWTLIWTTIKVAWDLISGYLRIAWDILKAEWRVLWDLVKTTAKLAWDLVGNIVTTGWHWIMNTFGVFIDLLTGKWGQAWQDAKKLVSQGFDDVKKLFGDFGHDALNMLYQAGKDVIQGLINGVTDMLGAAVSTVQNIGSSLVGGFKSLLGIGSPSRVFYEHGQNIVAGLVGGISDGRGSVGAAIAGLATAAGPGALGSGAFASAGTGLGGFPGGGGAGMSLVVEVYVDGKKTQGTVRTQTLRYQYRNSRNNLTLTGFGG